MTASGKYWKADSRLASTIWQLLAVCGFLVALAVNILVPANLPGYLPGDIYSSDYPTNPSSYRVVLAATAILLAAVYIFSYVAASHSHSDSWICRLQLRFAHKAQFILAGALAIALWDLLSSKLFILRPPYFPGPVNILAYIPNNWFNLLTHVAASSQLFIVGLTLGAIAGIGTGILLGWFRQWLYWLFPVLKFTGVIPATAWMPIATVLLHPAPVAMTFLLVIASWFVIAFTMCQGMQATPKIYYEVSATLGASRSYQLFHVAIPHALPSIFTGISTATSLSLVTLVAAEMMGATAGLGYFINYSKTFNKWYQVYAALIIMFIVFSIILALISLARDRILRWQKGLIA
jgi:NitT/TauT family transport system permease protein